jgi:hypothetical protein
MIARNYTVAFTGVAVTAQQDLFEITAAAGKNVELVAMFLSQSTEVGDAQEEGLSILIKTGAATSGTGGTAPTPVPLTVTDAAAGFAAEVNNTTKASTGTIVTHHADNWNVRMPFIIIFPEDMRVSLTGSRRLTVELATTPADSITMSGTLYLREFG